MAQNNGLIFAALAVGAGLFFVSQQSGKQPAPTPPQPSEPAKKDTTTPPVAEWPTLPPYVPGMKGWYLIDPKSFAGDTKPMEWQLTSLLGAGEKVAYAIGDDPEGTKATIVVAVVAIVKAGPFPVKDNPPQYDLSIEAAQLIRGEPSKLISKLPSPGTIVRQWRNRLVSSLPYMV